MAGESVIDVQLFVQTAEALNPVVKSLQTQFGEWQNALNSLRGEWQGDTSDNIRNTANQISKSSEALMNSIASWQSALNQLAGIYDSAEKKVSEEAKTLKFEKGAFK